MRDALQQQTFTAFTCLKRYVKKLLLPLHPECGISVKYCSEVIDKVEISHVYML